MGPCSGTSWPELFVNGLVARHTSCPQLPVRGMLGNEILGRIREYIVANIGEPIEVAALAKIAGRSPFHFSRVFSRSVGVSPHRYIVHLRLLRALELARGGQAGLAEIAVRTGFADQSHLWRWFRRGHGVSLTQVVTLPASQRNDPPCSTFIASQDRNAPQLCAGSRDDGGSPA